MWLSISSRNTHLSSNNILQPNEIHNHRAESQSLSYKDCVHSLFHLRSPSTIFHNLNSTRSHRSELLKSFIQEFCQFPVSSPSPPRERRKKGLASQHRYRHRQREEERKWNALIATLTINQPVSPITRFKKLIDEEQNQGLPTYLTPRSPNSSFRAWKPVTQPQKKSRKNMAACRSKTTTYNPMIENTSDRSRAQSKENGRGGGSVSPRVEGEEIESLRREWWLSPPSFITLRTAFLVFL